jgi:hypothetical protein
MKKPGSWLASVAKAVLKLAPSKRCATFAGASVGAQRPGGGGLPPLFSRHPLAPQLAACMLFLTAACANAETTNGLSDAEIEGQALARKILEQRPAENSTNTGILKIRPASGGHVNLSVRCLTIVTPADWRQIYEATATNLAATLLIIHAPSAANIYFYRPGVFTNLPLSGDAQQFENLFHAAPLSPSELATPFAGSDFWFCDFGVEFLHWPRQKMLAKTKDTKPLDRGREYRLLECGNPSPAGNSYARVVLSVDKESDGILDAIACDRNGDKIKFFELKDLQKVNGQYEVKTLVMENSQTKSSSRLEFELNK